MSQDNPAIDLDLRQAIEARLRYYRDLGVYDLYRRCEPEPNPLLKNVTVEVTNTGVEQGTVSRGGTAAHISSPATGAALPVDLAGSERAVALEAIRADIGDCTRCPLAFQGRHKIVFADGDPNARLMFVGEGPGADEDAQGLPFVGRAGQLLNNMINAMGLKREQVYIANVVKCRPPQNRTPEPEEANTCMQFLWRQIDAVHPEVLVALGATAATYLLGGKASLSSLRGRLHRVRNSKLIVTYHPAYLLRDPRQKVEAWKDLQIAMAELGLKAAKRPAS